MSIAEAVRSDLAHLPEEAQNSALAALALSIAERLDDERIGLRDLAAVARELRLTMEKLLELRVPEDTEGDRLLASLGEPGV